MNYALIENGQVVNLIWLHPDNAADFPGAVPCGDVPVQVGDTYDGELFFRDGQRVLTLWEDIHVRLAEVDEALLELQYQQLIGGLEE